MAGVNCPGLFKVAWSGGLEVVLILGAWCCVEVCSDDVMMPFFLFLFARCASGDSEYGELCAAV